MQNQSVLIVDDEKNIRVTLSQVLESMDLRVKAAVNGEEALEIMKNEEFSVVLLDLKLPGMDGMEVLKKISAEFPYSRVVIISAHGSIESAVTAMKLGAIDFLQKPFSPAEIRELVDKVMKRDQLAESENNDYSVTIELTKKYLNRRNFKGALEIVKKAVAMDPSKPEAFNLLGVIHEIKGEKIESQKYYRAALDVDPTYKPARDNLDRATMRSDDTDIDFGR